MTTVVGAVMVVAVVVWWLALQSVAAFAVELHHVASVVSALIGGN